MIFSIRLMLGKGREEIMKDKEFYTTVEVAEVLGIQLSTVRKYASLLERYDYPIQRDYSNNRIYSKSNIKMLRELQDLRQKFTLAEAADLLTIQYRKPATNNEYEMLIIEMEKLQERLYSQESHNQLLSDKVESLEKKLDAFLSVILENDEDGHFTSEYQRIYNQL